MIRRIYLRAGVWPGLILPLFFSKSSLGGTGAVLLALIYGGVYLFLIRPGGFGGALNYGLVFFLMTLLAALMINPAWGGLLLEEYFFFGAYSALFLASMAPLWLGLTTEGRGSEIDHPDLAPRLPRALSAALLLAAALISLAPGFIFKLAVPILLILGAWWVYGRGFEAFQWPRPRLEESPAAEPAVETRPQPRPRLDEESLALLGRVKDALVIQGSPRGPVGITALALRPFVNGLAAEGAKVDVVHLKDFKINPCTGCFDCWTKTPGRCVLEDDMEPILKRLAKTDLVVLAQPLYVGGLPGLTQTFLDRCAPLWEPWLVAHPHGGTYRPPRGGTFLGRRLVLLAVGSLPEESAFEPLIAHVEAVAALGEGPVVGRLIRPAADLLVLGPRLGRIWERIDRAFFQAGVETARLGRVRPETEATVKEPLFRDEAAFRLVTNLNWETWQEYWAAKRAGLDLPPLATFLDRDIRMNLGVMVLNFNPGVAGDVAATFQFNLSGRQPGQWYLRVQRGRCSFHEGWARDPDLIIHAPSEAWVALARGEMDSSQALADGLVRLEGRDDLFGQMSWLFSFGQGGADA